MSSDTSLGSSDRTVDAVPPDDAATVSAPAAAGGGDDGGGSHSDPILGRVIDGCKVVRKLGQGGMGVVYLARHEGLGQDFVLKILNPALTGAEDTVERFFREAQACAQLNHPGIVAIQNVGQEQDYYYIRMEYIEGVTLEDIVKEERQLDWRRATQMVLETAEALSHAHQKGMIHRDIKPENIMFTPKDEVKVMDFGLAKHVHSSAKVSVTGQIVGTPFFMSPEQAGGKPTDARSDIYSLGVTLYYLVTGHKPFNGKNLQEIFLKHFFYAPESPKIYNDALPDALCEVVKRCLKKKKKERYQSAKALAQDLQAVLDHPDAALGEHSTGRGAPAAGVPAAAGEPGVEEIGDRTVVAGPATSEAPSDATVRVGGGADSDAAHTVRVEKEGGEATVVAPGGRPRGEVRTVSFNTASGVYNEEEATLTIEGEAPDEEPAHAGLDLPTALLERARRGKEDSAEDAEADAEAEAVAGLRASKRKKLLAVVGLTLFLLLGVGVVYQQNTGDLDDLLARYNRLQADPDAKAEDYGALARDLEEFRGRGLAPTGRAEQLLGTVNNRLTDITGREQAERERRAIAQQFEEAERTRQERLDAVLARMRASLSELEQLRMNALATLARGEDTGPLWRAYVRSAATLLERRAAEADEFPEVAELLRGVSFPVIVTSEPEGADIYLNDRAEPEASVPGAAVLVAWVRPHQQFTLRVVKRGFAELIESDTADDVKYVFAELRREEVRAPISFGAVEVRYGAERASEPMLPAHDPAVVSTRGGRAYFVDHTGVLRALDLRRGRSEWRCPGGSGCAVDREGQRHGHEVGLYGDPTPRLEVVEGRVILAASLLGRLTAHDPSQEGKIIWTSGLGASLTSPPTFNPVLNVIAVGTVAGDVLFLNHSGQAFWRFSTEGAIRSAPYFWGDRVCLVGSSDNRLYSLDWREKRAIDHLDLGSDAVVGPVPVGRQLLVGTARGQVHRVDVDGEGRLREQRVLALPGDAPVAGIEVYADQVFFSAGRSLHAFSDSGEELWERGAFTATANLTAPLVPIDGGLVYVGSEDGTLYAIERESGDVRWRFRIPDGGSIRHRPMIAEDELLVISGDRLHVLAAD